MDKTINITRNLNKKGFKANLKIIGSINFSKNFPKYISQIGFINKNIRKEHLKLINILSNSDFHILMTKKKLVVLFLQKRILWSFQYHQ